MPSDYGDSGAVRVPATMSAYPPPKLSEPLPCPRCHSTNTKFCYYNNYNLSQPRHFCKSCRRYWTHGGTLRNIPIGGGTRKNASSSAAAKRARSSSCISSSSTPTVAQEPEPVRLPNSVSTGLESVQTHTGPEEPETNGNFSSLLTGQSDGASAFIALGGSGPGFGFEYGYGFDEMGLEFGGYFGGGSETAANANGLDRDTWRHESGIQEDSLVWPGFEISTPRKNMN